MSDGERSLRPAFEESAGFRESTLFLFPPDDAAALRHVGLVLHTLALEAGPYYGAPGESLTRRELQAARVDMLHVRDFLWAISREVEESELSADDARLSLVARALTSMLERTMSALDEELKEGTRE